MDSQQQEDYNMTLQRHEKDHFLGPFVGLSPEYMEMSESYVSLSSKSPDSFLRISRPQPTLFHMLLITRGRREMNYCSVT